MVFNVRLGVVGAEFAEFTYESTQDLGLVVLSAEFGVLGDCYG